MIFMVFGWNVLFPAWAGVILTPADSQGGACLFPAWAGVIPGTAFTDYPFGAFPRMGGGDPVAENIAWEENDFSPHGRG